MINDGVTLPATGTRMTNAEFRALPETNVPVELINGVVIVSPSPRRIHQKEVGETYRQIADIADTIPGSEAMISPMDVILDDLNTVQPDVFWVSGENSLCQVGEDDYWYGAPDLVVEVLSPGTRQHDLSEKFLLYEKHGCREYWIINPKEHTLTQWMRQGERFAGGTVYRNQEVFVSPVLNGAKIDLGRIWA